MKLVLVSILVCAALRPIVAPYYRSFSRTLGRENRINASKAALREALAAGNPCPSCPFLRKLTFGKTRDQFEAKIRAADEKCAGLFAHFRTWDRLEIGPCAEVVNPKCRPAGLWGSECTAEFPLDNIAPGEFELVTFEDCADKALNGWEGAYQPQAHEEH